MRVILVLVSFLFCEIAFAQEPFKNPFRGNETIADWKKHLAAGNRVDKYDGVVIDEVRFLNTKAEFDKNTTAADLDKLIRYIYLILARELKKHKVSGKIILQVTINANRNPEFQMQFLGDIKFGYLKSIYNSLSSIEMNTRESPIQIRIHFRLRNT